MKRINLIVIAALVASLFLSAYVIPLKSKPDWPAPVVTTLNGDAEYTVTIVNPAQLAGATVGGQGYPLPVGFPSGEKKFGGDAVIISGVSGGSQSVCFAFPTYTAGWRGSIYQWAGSAWQALSTTFSEGSDGTPELACTTVYGNGTYALLIYFSAADAPVSASAINTSTDDCIMDLRRIGLSFDSPDRTAIQARVGFIGMADGVKYTWVIIEAEPAGVFGALPISGTGTSQFGYVSTGYLPIDPLPTSMLISIRAGGVCHAGRISLEFDD